MPLALVALVAALLRLVITAEHLRLALRYRYLLLVVVVEGQEICLRPGLVERVAVAVVVQ
jgi:hypothetical protein